MMEQLRSLATICKMLVRIIIDTSLGSRDPGRRGLYSHFLEVGTSQRDTPTRGICRIDYFVQRLNLSKCEGSWNCHRSCHKCSSCKNWVSKLYKQNYPFHIANSRLAFITCEFGNPYIRVRTRLYLIQSTAPELSCGAVTNPHELYVLELHEWVQTAWAVYIRRLQLLTHPFASQRIFSASS